MTKAELLGGLDDLIARWTEAREILSSLRAALEADPVAEVRRELKASADGQEGEAPKRRRGRPPGSGRKASGEARVPARRRPEEMTALRGTIPDGPVVVSAAVAAQRRPVVVTPAESKRDAAKDGAGDGAGAYSLEALVRQLGGVQGGAA